MPFDDSVPKGNETAEEFYKIYGPVFVRNLRFDDRLNPDRKPPAGGGKKKNKRKQKPTGPPSFGDDETPLDQVHAFYDYWTNFESWRDFSLQAAKLTNNQNFDADNVDSRYEKRFIQKEIDRKAKSLKKEEVARVNLLVERSMATDPRLRREKMKAQNEKERIERERRESAEKEERETRERVEREAGESAVREKKEKEEKAVAKASKEKEKKIMRKAKATLRKLCLAAHSTGETYWTSMDAMYDDIEFLCEKLHAAELGDLSTALGGIEAIDAPKLEGVDVIQEKVMAIREGKSHDEIQTAVKAEQAKRAGANGNGHGKPEDDDGWTADQDAKLQEGLAKFPASLDKNERWDSIAKCVEGKSKKDCVDRFKAIREALKNKK
jgi:DnaJ family protein C protein 2